MEQVPKKGMSKGCLVALIVVGALIVIMLIGLATCWYYKDEIFKFGGTAAINQVKAKLAEAPPEGVDTAQFNALSDAFVARMNEEEELDLQSLGEVMQTAQYVASEKTLDSTLVRRLENAMISYYPDLKELQGEQVSPDEVMNDTMMPQEETVDEE